VESEDPELRLPDILPEEWLPSEPSFNEPELEDARESPEPEDPDEESHGVMVVVMMLTGPFDTGCAGGTVVVACDR